METCLYARNLKETAAFYREVLRLEKFSEAEDRHVFFRCGQAMMLLFNPDKTMTPGQAVPPHGAYGQGHIAFRIPAADIPRWLMALESHNIDIEAQVDWPSGGKSIYFRDPADNSVELATAKTWNLKF